MVDTHTRSTPAQSHLVAVVDLCPASTSGHQRGLYYLNRLIDESHTVTIDSSLECELSPKIWDGLSEWAAGVSHSPHESLRRDVLVPGSQRQSRVGPKSSTALSR